MKDVAPNTHNLLAKSRPCLQAQAAPVLVSVTLGTRARVQEPQPLDDGLSDPRLGDVSRFRQYRASSTGL